MSKYKVSAIISTYNSEKYIKKRIENLLTQTICEQLEIIIINSGSQQNEDAIIKHYLEKYSNIRYIHTEQRETIYKAWNRGIKISSGIYITNCNTDDLLCADALEVMSDYLEKNPNIAMVYSDQYTFHNHTCSFKDMSELKILKRPDFSRIKLLERCIIGPQPMWRASLHFSDDYWFNEKYEIAGDYEFELKVARDYDIAHVRCILGFYYLSPNKENKEYQSTQKTFDETYEIMYHYSVDYIKNLTDAELEDTVSKLEWYVSIPKYFLVIFKFFFNRFFPHKELLARSFVYWFLSIAYEVKNDSSKAQYYCEKYLRNSSSQLIENQINHLKGIKFDATTS